MAGGDEVLGTGGMKAIMKRVRKIVNKIINNLSGRLQILRHKTTLFEYVSRR